MIIHLHIIGITMILLAIIHAVFPRYFHWKKQLHHLSLINRQLMYVHTFFIALFVFFIGLLCLTSSFDLLTTTLGKKLCLGLSLFWFIRLYFQFFVYSPLLWKRKVRETIIHILFVLLWTYFASVFFIAHLNNNPG